jgi:hypothetical protein
MHRERIERLLASVVGLRAKAAELNEQVHNNRMVLHDLMAMRREIIGYRREALNRLRKIQEEGTAWRAEIWS